MKRERVELFFGILFILVVVVGVNLLARARAHHAAPASVASETPTPLPPLTDNMRAAVENNAPFQYVISYTDAGFEPAMLTIKSGETVRFTNNSSKPLLWVAATGASGKVYPDQKGECGDSAFDSCATLEGGQFWQFTFTTTGTWSYKNNADTSKTGTILVQ